MTSIQEAEEYIAYLQRKLTYISRKITHVYDHGGIKFNDGDAAHEFGGAVGMARLYDGNHYTWEHLRASWTKAQESK